eukprot:SAG22_NODE_1944_length_3283_cov_13.320666_3_plen_130_part_00
MSHTTVRAAAVLTQHLGALAEVAAEFPTLHILINHSAGILIDGNPPSQSWTDAVVALRPFPNVYLKCSGQMEASTTQPAPVGLEFYQPLFGVLYAAFGPERMVVSVTVLFSAVRPWYVYSETSPPRPLS